MLHLRAIDRFLFLEDLRGHGPARDVGRARRGDLHRDFLDQRRELFAAGDLASHAAELELDAERPAQVDVLPDDPLTGISHESRYGYVLAELRDFRRHQPGNRPVRIPPPGVAGGVARLFDFAEHVLHELLEIGRARDEVRLAVHFDQDAARSIGREAVADQPLARDAAGLLGRARQPALAQDRVRFREVAVRLGQGRLALHHPGARLLAQLLHHVGGNCQRRHHISRQGRLASRPC